jgi:hypothetical protein
MARPTQTRINESPGFAPAANRSPSLQVVAPLNVQAAPSGAELLAQSLGIVLDAATPIVQRKTQEHAAEAAALGRIAGQTGAVDAKRQAEDASYAFGVKRALVDKAVVDYKSMAANFYETQFDKSQGTEVLAAELDKIAKGALSAYAGDPDAARWMLPEVERTMATITGAHDAQLAQQFKDDAVATQGALIREDLDDDGAVDPQAYLDKLKPLLGNSDAQKAYVGIIGSLAVERADPAIIDALIPEYWTDSQTGQKIPGPRSNPALNAQLNQDRFYAQSAADKADDAKRAATKQAADEVYVSAIFSALAGVDPRPMLAKAVMDGIIPPEDHAELRSTINFWDDQQQEEADRQTNASMSSLLQFRAEILSDPLKYDPFEVAVKLAQLVPPGDHANQIVQTFFDDYTSTYKSARDIDNNPTAKAYLEAIASEFKPDNLASAGDPERVTYSAAVLAFRKTMIASGDPEKANEEARRILKNGTPQTVKPTAGGADPKARQRDVQAVFDNKMSPAEFKRAYAGQGTAIAQDASLPYEVRMKAVQILNQ